MAVCRMSGGLTLAAGLLLPGVAAQAASADDSQTVAVARVHTADSDGGAEAGSNSKRIIIERVEPDNGGGKSTRKEVAWLGIGTEEASEALASQLGLTAGEGLLLTYVAPDSPAAKAGLQKNDVLVKLDEQLMVHPAQLRKLVRLHKTGDSVQLELFRGGKRQDVSVTLGKTTTGIGLLRDERGWQGDLGQLQFELHDLAGGGAGHGEMKELYDSLAKAGLDKDALRIEVKRSLDQARQAASTALRQASNQLHGANLQVLEDLARSGVDVDKDATVIVKRHENSVQTQVKADDSGTYVIVANPKKRLTAHDKDGKLLFDGEIETPEQQEKVPKDVWSKVEPMLKQFGKTPDETPDEN